MNGSHDDSLASSNLRCTASPSPCGLKLLYDSDSEMLLDHSCEMKCQHRHGSLTTSFPLEKHQQDMWLPKRWHLCCCAFSHAKRSHTSTGFKPIKGFLCFFHIYLLSKLCTVANKEQTVWKGTTQNGVRTTINTKQYVASANLQTMKVKSNKMTNTITGSTTQSQKMKHPVPLHK